MQSSGLVHAEGSGDRLGSCLRMLEQLETGGIVSLPGEATGIENGNRGSETAAYESLGSGFRHKSVS